MSDSTTAELKSIATPEQQTPIDRVDKFFLGLEKGLDQFELEAMIALNYIGYEASDFFSNVNNKVLVDAYVILLKLDEVLYLLKNRGFSTNQISKLNTFGKQHEKFVEKFLYQCRNGISLLPVPAKPTPELISGYVITKTGNCIERLLAYADVWGGAFSEQMRLTSHAVLSKSFGSLANLGGRVVDQDTISMLAGAILEHRAGDNVTKLIREFVAKPKFT